MTNPYRDVNPYEPPAIVQAELARPERPYQPPQPAKPWPPIFAMIWLVAGPFVWFRFMALIIDDLKLINERDNATVITVLAAGVVLWLIAGARVMIWLVRSMFGY
jgi:hypothetical protein